MRKIILLFLNFISIYAFEVNTHQALTRCAITSSCGNGYSKNLYDFVKHGDIKYQSHANEIFEKYGKTYRAYANEGTGFEDWQINISNPNYIGMIEAGSVLEDAVYPQHDFAGDGRFNNHFYATQFQTKRTLFMRTSRTLTGGYGVRTDNIDWVFNLLGNNSPTLGSKPFDIMRS